jgi:hypothetical protein
LCEKKRGHFLIENPSCSCAPVLRVLEKMGVFLEKRDFWRVKKDILAVKGDGGNARCD